MFKRNFYVICLLLAAIWADGRANVSDVTLLPILQDIKNPVLISFDCDDKTAVKFNLYLALPAAPDDWIPYKSSFSWWLVINEPHSPHKYTINIKFFKPSWIGVVNVGVSSVNIFGKESEIVRGKWEINE